MSETYNGWANYETWRVDLEMFDGCAASDFLSRGRGGRSSYIADLSQVLCDHAFDKIEGEAQGLALDYARAFLEAVNYREIAEKLLCVDEANGEADDDETDEDEAEEAEDDDELLDA